MIPRVLHRIWLGRAPIPEDFRRYEETWRQHHPDWELRLWTDADIDGLVDPDVVERCRNAAELSDVLRYRILADHGGVYVDTDVECLRPLDDVLEGAELVAGREGKRKVGSAVIAAVPGHPAMLRAAAEVAEAAGEGPQMQATGPHFLTRVLADFPDASILSREVLYPRRWFESQADPAVAARSYAVHHVARSWGPDPEKITRLREAQAQLEARRNHAEARARRAEERAERAERRLAKARRRAANAERRATAAERRWMPPRAVALLGSVGPRLRRLRRPPRGGRTP